MDGYRETQIRYSVHTCVYVGKHREEIHKNEQVARDL